MYFGFRIFFGLLIVLTFLVQGSIGHACTCAYPVVVHSNSDKKLYKKICRTAPKNKSRFLQNVKNGKFETYQVRQAAEAFNSGNFGCRKDKDFAFKIIDSLIPSPVPLTARPDILNLWAWWAPKTLESGRMKQIRGLAWLRGQGGNWIPKGWAEEEMDMFLSIPEHFDLAFQSFGNNPRRDQMLFEKITDPKNSNFNLQMATQLISETKDKDRKTALALKLLDPQLGKPNYDAAAKLLDWYSPFIDYGLAPERVEQAKAAWVRIAQSRISSNDLAIKARAIAILETGNPHADPMLRNSELWPAVSDLIVLDGWIDSLPSLESKKPLEKNFRQNAYPSRAMREKRTGAVTVAALFAKDGSFRELFVQSSSGHDDLDQATVKSWKRYFRPRFSEMKLVGFPSNNVLIPLPSVEWRLVLENSENPGGVTYDDGVIAVSGKRRFSGGGCSC